MKKDDFQEFISNTYPLINLYDLIPIYCTDKKISKEELKNFKLTADNIIMMFPYSISNTNSSTVKRTYIHVKGKKNSNTGKCPPYLFCIRMAIWENGNEFEGAIIIHTDPIHFLNDTFHFSETEILYNNMTKCGIIPIRSVELPVEIEQHLNFKSFDDDIRTGIDLFNNIFINNIPIDTIIYLKGACEYDYDSSIVNFNLYNVDRVYYYEEFFSKTVAICRLDKPRCYVYIIHDYNDNILTIFYSKDKKVFAKIVLPSKDILSYNRNKIQESILKDFSYIPPVNSIPGLIKNIQS